MLRSTTSRFVDHLGAPSVYNSAASANITALTTLLRRQKPVNFMAKKFLFQEGDSVDSVFLIAGGAVCLYRFLPSGRRLIARFLFADEIAGLSFNDEYPFTAECITPTTVFKFMRKELHALCAHSPALQNDMVLALKQELTSEREDHLPLMHQAAHIRVACLLRMMALRNGVDYRQGVSIRLPMRRGDIADYLGLTLETVCRSFKKLKDDGLISASTPDQVWIEDVSKLMALTDGY
jgi:CRP/FNR family transcriptional regulator